MGNFINQFPYADFHELNLDWLLAKTKQLQADMTAMQEEMAQIEILTEAQIRAMITAAIQANNITVYAEMTALEARVTSAYQTYTNNQINILKNYVDAQDQYYDGLAQGYASTALDSAKTYTDDQVLNYTMMINPVTGEYEDVRNVVTDIVSYFHSDDTLTAGEYDALAMDASAYDAKDLTALDYDFNGKNLLP